MKELERNKYICEYDAQKMLQITNGPNYRECRAFIINSNCVARYRNLSKEGNKKEDEQVINAIEEDKLYFSTALGYNDPYDTLMFIDKKSFYSRVSDCLEKDMDSYLIDLQKRNLILGLEGQAFVSELNPHRDDNKTTFFKHIDMEIEKIKADVHNNIKGICFSKCFTSILMWAHYANCHQGIALLYDKMELESAPCFDIDNKQLEDRFDLENVNYKDKRVDATRYINDYIIYNRVLVPEKMYRVKYSERPSRAVLKDIILTKDISWSYEEEMRLIPRHISFEKEAAAHFLLIKPKGIILGYKINPELREKIRQIALEKDIVLYETWINDQKPEYKMVFQEVMQ